MNLTDQLTAHNNDRRLFGLPIQQSHAAILLYEQLLWACREELHWIVEIGTGSGALTRFWGMWSAQLVLPDNKTLRGAPCFTCDITMPLGTWGDLPALGCKALLGDCFRDCYGSIARTIRYKPGFLFLDGGDKPRELATFGPIAAKGSIVVVHDYGPGPDAEGRPAEIGPADVAKVPEVDFLEPWHTQSMELKAKAAVLRRV
jgi:hypothetical protein